MRKLDAMTLLGMLMEQAEIRWALEDELAALREAKSKTAKGKA